MAEEVERVRIVVLCDDRVGVYRIPVLAEHGLCLYLEVEWGGDTCALIFDTGKTGKVLLENARSLGVDLSRADLVVLSHNHYDHTGGLAEIAKELAPSFSVIAHPEILSRSLHMDPSLRYVGVPVECRRILEERLIPLSKHAEISPGIIFLGEIPRRHGEERVEGFYKVEGGRVVEYGLEDDTGLAIRVRGGGVLVITGCSHSGVVNIVEHALEVSGSEKLLGVVGGFHLIGASRERILWTAEKLRELRPSTIAPLHCTGIEAEAALLSAMPDSYVFLGAGSELVIEEGAIRTS